MNFAAAQDAIVALIQAAVPASVKVLVSEDLAAVEERSQHTPAVHVVYSGYRVQETSHQGRAARVVYSFDVVAVSRSAKGSGHTEDASLRAANLCQTVVRHLMGQPIAPCNNTPLTLVTGPRAVVGAGFIYLPASFEVAATVRANP